MAVIREKVQNVYRTQVSCDEVTETCLTVRPETGEPLESVVARLANALDSQDTELVKLDVFGPCALFEEGRRLLAGRFNGLPCPLQWVEGAGGETASVAGVQALAVSGTRVNTIRHAGRPVGRLFNAGGARYCFLADVRPERIDGTKADQARRTFELLAELLRQAGMDLNALTRTWLYNADILSWYKGFNGVRTAFFNMHKVFDGLVPASTAVGGTNPAGAALVASALAVQPRAEAGDAVSVNAVPSPLQCPALDYGSFFSRAVEIASGAFRRLIVSGTASIGPAGETLYPGDVVKQIGHTMEVVEAILDGRGMTLSDVTRALAYFKRIEDASAFDRYLGEHQLSDLPAVVAQNAICRDDLLFEIEVDAVSCQ